MRRERGVGWLSAAAWAMCALGVVAAVASRIDGGAWLAQLQAAGPLMGLAGAALACALLVLRRWPQAVVAAVCALVLVAPVISAPPTFVRPAGRTLSVMAINTFIGGADATAIMQQIERRRPDVLVLPEMHDPLWIRLEKAGIREYLPYATGRSGGGVGMVVATRRPAECLELTPGTRCGEVVLNGLRPGDTYDARGRLTFDQTTLRLSDGTVLRGVHLWSTRLPPYSRWREQQGEMADWIASRPEDEPLVLAGDFNAGPSHPVFRGYADTMERLPRGGFPWPRTWHVLDALPAFTQIDHVLTRGWHPVAVEVFDVPGTDHRGVWAELTR